jgi:heptaprenyl diphosphate synthase
MRSSASGSLPPARAAIRRTTDLALLTAASLVVYVFESLVPAPLPWLRLGLANVVTVTVLRMDGVWPALVVTLLRVLLGSLLVGSFLSPAFLLSLSGAATALMAMAAARGLAPRAFSVVGISVTGAVAHNLGQLLALAALVLRAPEALRLLPYLVLSATLVGVLSGFAAHALCAHLIARRGGHHGTGL